MKRTQVIAVLVGLAATLAISSPAHARLYMMMHGSNVYPGVSTPMPPMPAAPMMAAPMPPMSPMMAISMPGRMPAPMAGGFDRPHVGVNVYPDAAAAMSVMPRDPMDPPVLFDPTGQHPDGPNLYQYVRSNPVRWQDPQGTNIYLKTGNNSGNSINDAIHQNVCVDTCENGKKGIACFSFGATGEIRWFSSRGTWLGWELSWLGGTGAFWLMEGVIDKYDDAGTVVQTKQTTAAQDQAWLNWMRTNRVGTKDIYSVLRFNCRKYAQMEFADAPGNH